MENVNGIARTTLDLFTSEGAPDVTGRAEIDSDARLQKILRILDARFSLSGLEKIKRETPGWWDSPQNAIGRGLYGEAMREAEHLKVVPDDVLNAEIAAFRAPSE